MNFSYDPVGSGGGREQFLAGGVDFAGSDSALNDDELTKAKDRCGEPGVFELPDYISAIAVVYNLDGVDKLQPLAGHHRRHLQRARSRRGTTRRSPPTTRTPSCRAPRSRPCTAATSPAPRRTSPTT